MRPDRLAQSRQIAFDIALDLIARPEVYLSDVFITISTSAIIGGPMRRISTPLEEYGYYTWDFVQLLPGKEAEFEVINREWAALSRAKGAHQEAGNEDRPLPARSVLRPGEVISTGRTRPLPGGPWCNHFGRLWRQQPASAACARAEGVRHPTRCTDELLRGAVNANHDSMIERPYWLRRIEESRQEAPIVWLAGVRRVGKSTLGLSLGPERIKNIPRSRRPPAGRLR